MESQNVIDEMKYLRINIFIFLRIYMSAYNEVQQNIIDEIKYLHKYIYILHLYTI